MTSKSTSSRRLAMASLLVAAACAGRSVGSSNEPGAASGTGGRGTGAGASGGTAGTGTATGASGGVAGAGASGGVAGSTGGFSSCFEAGSLVATPRGSVPIEALAVGDEVLAFDERNGVVAPRRIRRTFVHETTSTGTLTLRDGRTLRVTPEHPIFVAATQSFERADSIQQRDEFVTLPLTLAGVAPATAFATAVLVSSNGYSPRERDAPVTVYNLSVDDFETYFVDGVLVHNKGGGPGISGSAGMPGRCGPELLQGVIHATCPPALPCLDPLAPEQDFVTLNRPVEGPAGGGGAGGEGQVASSGAPNAGAPGEDPLGGYRSLELRYCNPDDTFPSDRSYYLAFDAYQPSGGSPTHVIQQSLGDCFGVVIGDVVLTDYDVPPTGSWTTQCVRLGADELFDELLLSVGLLTDTRIANPRFVSGCECPRHIKRHTTCGYDPGGIGGGSACEPP